jgi:hypothetical protein
MITENQLNQILLISNENNESTERTESTERAEGTERTVRTEKEIQKRKNYKKNIFGSPIKKFITKIFDVFDIPIDCFKLSLFYLNKYYKIHQENIKKSVMDNSAEEINKILDNFFENLSLYVFSGIMIALKQLMDKPFNLRYMCDELNINFNKIKIIELDILKTLNWETGYINSKYTKFKMKLAHYTY